MIERRQHNRFSPDSWASLRHPLLGTVTAEIRDISSSGVSLELDTDMNYFVTMDLDVKFHGEGWDDSMPRLPVQVVRVEEREVALRFLDNPEDYWTPPEDDDILLPDGTALDDELSDLSPAAM